MTGEQVILLAGFFLSVFATVGSVAYLAGKAKGQQEAIVTQMHNLSKQVWALATTVGQMQKDLNHLYQTMK